MGARPTPPKGCMEGNFVSEWFGHQVWPRVDTSKSAVSFQSARFCPFLTNTIGRQTLCVKSTKGWDEPYGVCTISSDSNGIRQDWIACPYRTFDQHFILLKTAIGDAFSISHVDDMSVFPVTILHRGDIRHRIRNSLASGRKVFLISTQKLGGEIELPETESSPGASVDVSIIELLALGKEGEAPVDAFGKHMFYEIQTADFHGSPLHAAKLLKEKCPIHSEDNFHDSLVGSEEICGTGVEGPNKSNIFKRTIYQMILKMEIARFGASAGFAILLPVPVWDSWVRHLGRPELKLVNNLPETYELNLPDQAASPNVSGTTSSIYVFKIDETSKESPRPLKILTRIIVSPEALTYYAFKQAAEKANELHVITKFRHSLRARVIAGIENKINPKEKAPRVASADQIELLRLTE